MERNILNRVAAEIRQMVETEEGALNSLDEAFVSSRLNRQNRSAKQIVGHMADSASNNLHRIVHLQCGEIPLVFPDYSAGGNNDRWIAIQNFQNEDWRLLLQLWKCGNLHLAHVIENIDPGKLDREWITANGEPLSLRDMIIDYPRHLRLHLDEIHEL